MAANQQLVHSNVQRILADNFNGVELWKDGWTLRHESARLFIRLVEQDERVLVALTAPLVFGCQPSPELFKHVAMEGGEYFFGHVVAVDSEAKIDLYFKHTLLGDFLDDGELEQAIIGLLGTANDLDDELAKTFGGKRFHED